MDVCQAEFSGIVQNVSENIFTDIKFVDCLAYLTLNACSAAHHRDYTDSHRKQAKEYQPTGYDSSDNRKQLPAVENNSYYPDYQGRNN